MTAKLQGIRVKVEDKLKRVKKVISSLKGLSAFFLFGSYARGRETLLSDIDFAFLPGSNMKPKEVEKLDRKLYRELSKALKTDDITLVNVMEAPLLLAYDILQGKVVFCRNPNDLRSFQEKVFTLYPEIKRIKDEWLKAYGKKLRSYANRH
jgi:predicted nucleotidyltransferase